MRSAKVLKRPFKPTTAGSIPVRPTIRASSNGRTRSRLLRYGSSTLPARTISVGEVLRVGRQPRKLEIAGSIPVTGSMPTKLT